MEDRGGCVQERWSGRRGRLPKRFLLNTQAKSEMLTADGETNTANCRNKYSNFLHAHIHMHNTAEQCQHLNLEATHTHTHENVSGCKLRWRQCRDTSLLGRKRGRKKYTEAAGEKTHFCLVRHLHSYQLRQIEKRDLSALVISLKHAVSILQKQ